MSASELVAAYRELCELNYGGKFTHFFDDVAKQHAGKEACCFCSGTLAAQLSGPCRPLLELERQEVDIMFTGSPCPPYSTQRTKRYVEGSVKAHPAFETTMTHVISLIKAYKPFRVVFEQVWGFAQPEVKGGRQTPKDRPGKVS